MHVTEEDAQMSSIFAPCDPTIPLHRGHSDHVALHPEEPASRVPPGRWGILKAKARTPAEHENIEHNTCLMLENPVIC